MWSSISIKGNCRPATRQKRDEFWKKPSERGRTTFNDKVYYKRYLKESVRMEH